MLSGYHRKSTYMRYGHQSGARNIAWFKVRICHLDAAACSFELRTALKKACA